MMTKKGDCSNETPDPPIFPPNLPRCKSPKCCNKPEKLPSRGLIGPKDYKNEPKDRSKLLRINSLMPFQGEPPAPVLLETYLTPNEIFYTCNHGPVGVLVDPFMYELDISGLLPKPTTFYQDAIHAMPKSRVPVTLMCAANRRTDMHQKKKLLEVPWGNAALGTAIWGGVRLADLLKMQGIPYRTLETDEGGRHVEFISVDYMKDAPDEPYKSSIPLIHATTPRADVLLAYEMNYEGFYMQKYFKHYPPHLSLDPPWVTKVDWYSRRPLMEFPVQSSICIPQDGLMIPKGATVTIRGYAIAGGGRAIDRVDVSVDGGRSWEDAERRQGSFPVPRPPCPCCGTVPPKVEIFDPFEADGKAACLKDPQLLRWTWVFWELVAKVNPPTEIIVKAVI
ncbi:hypothetical protein M758_10G179200 [Ceratodon purpureus]|nr:hypothetical protein M758_10G179200 [Ceratodon purpureus]